MLLILQYFNVINIINITTLLFSEKKKIQKRFDTKNKKYDFNTFRLTRMIFLTISFPLLKEFKKISRLKTSALK